MMIQPCWSNYSYVDSILDQDDLPMDFCTSEEHQNVSSPITINGFDDVCKWLCDDDDDQHMELIPSDSYEWSPNISMNSNDASMLQNDDVIPQNGIENLLTAYSEAIGLGQHELAKVIQNCICQKASPVGPTIERLALNLFKCGEEDCLKQELRRNFKTAFRAFYEIFPYGRFAHFTANSAITESVPTHVESVHIVDFDLCEGSQWPAVIEAVARMKKSLIITSIKLDQEQDQDSQFEQTKRNLFYFSRNLGISLKIQEINMDQIVKKIEGRQFMVFNCMVNLPHIGRARKSSQVIDFLNIAKGVLAQTEGIITFGDGDQESERMRNFSSFFNQNLTHYKALYESMEFGFPSYLNEARIAMETLFLAPFISSKSWFQKWEEHPFSLTGFGLNGRKISKESWNESRELVKEGESQYGIRIEGGNGNQMVLEWNGIPLVKVSVWM